MNTMVFFGESFDPVGVVNNGGPLILLVVVFFAFLYVLQLYRLMTVSDEYFPGQGMRLCWVVLFVFLWFLAPLLFLVWMARRSSVLKNTRERERRAERAATVVEA